MERLLLVDDEDSIRTGIRCFLASHGFQLDCASEREEAVALLNHVPYRGVIVDLCLTAGHGPDGLDVISAARENCPAARIIVLTALSAPDTEAEALRLGADVVLRKPQPLDKVLCSLRELLGDRA